MINQTGHYWYLKAIMLCCRGCPIHCGMFSNIPGLQPPYTSSIPQVVTIKNVSRHCKLVLIQFHQFTTQLCEKYVTETINVVITSKFRRLWNLASYFLGRINIRCLFHYYQFNLKLFHQFRESEWLCGCAGLPILLDRWPLRHLYGHQPRYLGIHIFFPSSQKMFYQGSGHNSYFWTSLSDLTSGNALIQ